MLCFTIQISLIWCMPFPQKINLHWLRPYLLFTLILMYKENPDNIIFIVSVRKFISSSFLINYVIVILYKFQNYFEYLIDIVLLVFSNWNTFFYSISSKFIFCYVMNQSSCQKWLEKWLEIHIHINRICEIQIDMIIDPSCKRLNQKFLIKFVRVWIFFARGNLNNYRWKYPMKDYHFPEKKRFCFEIFSIFLYLP